MKVAEAVKHMTVAYLRRIVDSFTKDFRSAALGSPAAVLSLHRRSNSSGSNPASLTNRSRRSSELSSRIGRGPV